MKIRLPAAETALKINPNMAEALCIKARYLEEEGRAEEAEQTDSHCA